MTVTYELYYFDFHGLAMIPRMLLSLGEFNWKNRFVKVGIVFLSSIKYLQTLIILYRTGNQKNLLLPSHIFLF
jgi:hypothetical protein